MSVSLQIPSPCAEPWSAMPLMTFDCRFCAACQKNIIDFTQKTDGEVLAHLKRQGKICGRFRPDQLNRPLVDVQTRRRGSLTTIAAGFATLLAAQHPSLTEGPKAPMTEAAQFPADNERISTAPQQESGTPDTLRTITGKVTDADSQEGLVGASVRLVGTHYGVRTDINGCFSLDVSSDTLVESEQVLEFSSIGYTLQTLHLSGLKNPVNFQIRMDPATLGLVGDISISHSTFKQRLKRFFHWNR